MSLRVSLSDIARATGCAKSTVSIALQGDQRVQLKTREKIRRIAEKMGYRPNPALASLASYRFHPKRKIQGIPLAFLTQDEFNIATEDYTYSLERDHASQLGYDLQHYHLPDLQKLRDPARMLYQRGVEGIVLSPFFDFNSLPKMNWDQFAIAALGGGVDPSLQVKSPTFHRVGVDHFKAVQTCWNKARQAGYRRIGFVFYNHTPLISDDIIRHAAGLYCLGQTSPKQRIPILHMSGPETADPRALSHWLKSHQPDVVIGFSGLISWRIEQLGWKIPEDIAYINLHMGKEKRLAGLAFIGSQVLNAAVELIDQQIRHRHRGIPEHPRSVTFESNWIPGASLPPKTSKTKSR